MQMINNSDRITTTHHAILSKTQQFYGTPQGCASLHRVVCYARCILRTELVSKPRSSVRKVCMCGEPDILCAFRRPAV
jgi:hypothetical protein